MNDIKWIQTDRESYDWSLEVVPPVVHVLEDGDFLMGEPFDSRGEGGQFRYIAFRRLARYRGSPIRYEKASRPLTIDEFRRSRHTDRLKETVQ